MNIFNGNQHLEAVTFDALDYALYSRHDISDVLVPFMMLHSGEDKKLVRLVGGNDPFAGLEAMLRQDPGNYDYIAMCCEGRLPHGDTKQDAILVKAWDTSIPEGFLFGQRFRGIESGSPFRKLGNPALLSRTEPLPVPLVDREEEEYDEPYVSGMVVQKPGGLKERVIVAAHPSASVLSPLLFDAVTSALSKGEADFSGEFLFNFVPDSLQDNGLNRFILQQLLLEIMEYPAVQQWESQRKRQVQISLDFNNGKGPERLQRAGGSKPSGGGTSQGGAAKHKPWWRFW